MSGTPRPARPVKATTKPPRKATPGEPERPETPARGGIRFPDPGLHIAVLGALLDSKQVQVREVSDLFKGLEKELEGLDPYDDLEERLEVGMRRLHALELEASKVAKLRSLDFYGANQIYMLLERACGTDSGGELDTYALGSLEGIGLLTGLERLSLDSHGYTSGVRDLSPLSNHPALTSLDLSSRCTGAEALLTMPALREVEAGSARLTPESVLADLAARGVTVKKG
jgi:hypothetical protein